MAKDCKTLVGVEIVEDAVKDANVNAKLNGIDNAKFICSDAASAVKTLQAEGLSPDVVILDPPRKGCGEELSETVSKIQHNIFVYVSCDQSSLERYLKDFVSLLPFDDEKFDVVTAVETYYFWPDKLEGLKEINRTLKHGGKILLIFEMLKTDDNPNKWKPIEERLNISAVTKDEIGEILLRAGYQNIQLHTKDGTSWLCAIAEKE